MLRRSALLALLSLLTVLGGATPASALTATSTEQIARELSRDQVYVADDVRVDVDEDALRSTVGGSQVQVYLAVVSERTAERAGGLPALVLSLGQTLGDSSAVVLAISDAPDVYADNGRAVGARGVNAGAALRQANSPRDFDEAGITALVQDFTSRIDAQVAGGGGGRSGGTRTGGGGLLLPLLLLGFLGFGVYALRSKRREARTTEQELQDARADVESLYGRLGSDVQLLSPGDDAIARQALADAAERYNATGALMAKADTLGEYAAARRTAAEGLAAARVVRQRLGLDPGPDVPMPHGEAPQLEAPTRVRVGDEEYDASPRYEPGRPHYYEGGYYEGRPVPGGWYATPFWQTLLLSSVLRGGLGGGYRRRTYYGGGMMGGGMFGGGFGGVSGRRAGGRRGGGGFGGFGGGGGWGSGGGGRRGGGGSW